MKKDAQLSLLRWHEVIALIKLKKHEKNSFLGELRNYDLSHHSVG